MVCGPIERAKRDVRSPNFCVHRLWPVRQITSWSECFYGRIICYLLMVSSSRLTMEN